MGAAKRARAPAKIQLRESGRAGGGCNLLYIKLLLFVLAMRNSSLANAEPPSSHHRGGRGQGGREGGRAVRGG